MPDFLFVYLGILIIKEIKVMFTVEQKSGKDYMGYTWFEVFKNGKTTGNSYNAFDEAHAIAMHKQLKQ